MNKVLARIFQAYTNITSNKVVLLQGFDKILKLIVCGILFPAFLVFVQASTLPSHNVSYKIYRQYLEVSEKKQKNQRFIWIAN